MLPKADLHIHTTSSDGRMSPEEAVKTAVNKKLTALSITDHDTISAYKTALPVAQQLNIELIPGVEISTTHKGKEAHLLAYYFDIENEDFLKFLLEQKIARRERIKVIIKTLAKTGVSIDYDEVWAEANGGNLGRPHIAKVLINKGFAAHTHDAFIRFLSNEKLGEIESGYPTLESAIKKVKNNGGAAILAHPGRLYSPEEVEGILGLGIDGLECIHPSHNFKKQLLYSELCEKNNLLKTGGSDCHESAEKAAVTMGIVTIAYKYVEAMKRMCDQRKKIN